MSGNSAGADLPTAVGVEKDARYMAGRMTDSNVDEKTGGASPVEAAASTRDGCAASPGSAPAAAAPAAPPAAAPAAPPAAAPAAPAPAKDRYAFLAGIDIFRGVPADKCAEVIRALDGSIRCVRRGDVIKNLGDDLTWFGIIRTGEIQAGIFDGEHDQIIERFGPGQVFGEAIALTSGRCTVEIRATADTEFVVVQVAPLFADRMGSAAAPYVTHLLANILRDMAEKLMVLNFKLRIMREPRLRNRIALYLKSLCSRQGMVATIPFSRTQLASYLGVDRSAMSRELGRMQDEGLISLDGRRVTVLRPDVIVYL